MSLSVCDYETAAIFDGRAPIEGCDVARWRIGAGGIVPPRLQIPGIRCHRNLDEQLSAVLARNDFHYVAIPAFVSRLFRHSGIYIRTDRGIRQPYEGQDHRPAGIPDDGECLGSAACCRRNTASSQATSNGGAAVWRSPAARSARGFSLPPGIDLQAVPADRSISDMLAKGEIDRLLSARAPSCYLRGAPNVDRLFPDYPAVEAAYFKKTKLFPIMHGVGIRRSLVEKYPWLAVNVYKAFLKAKALCMEELGRDRTPRHQRCRGRSHAYDHARKVMGEDYWPYGAHKNKLPLETLARYSFEQGLSVRQVSLEEMFAKPTYELSKIYGRMPS